jgi:hypothetical protein
LSLTLSEGEKKFRVYKKRVLRGIFWPTTEEVTGRARKSQKLGS